MAHNFITEKELIDKLEKSGYPMEECQHFYGKEEKIKSGSNLNEFPIVLSEVKENVFNVYYKGTEHKNVEQLYDVPDIYSVYSWLKNRKRISIQFNHGDSNNEQSYGYTIIDFNDLIIYKNTKSDVTYDNLSKATHEAIKYVLKNNLINSDMQKIMFNDKYHLTYSVLDGFKTMTRRLIPNKLNLYNNFKLDGDKIMCYMDDKSIASIFTRYKIGDIVAIAQSYDNIPVHHSICKDDNSKVKLEYPGSKEVKYGSSKGINNKMFVSADNMPHHIQITDIKIERFQDISPEDVIKEGIKKLKDGRYYAEDCITTPDYLEAYKCLIYRLGYKEAWDNNEFVCVYEFKLID